MAVGTTPAAPLPLRELLVELGDLKRVHSAGRHGSIAERLFAQGWAALTGGAAPRTVAFQVTANALAASRLCDIDEAFLSAVGLDASQAGDVLRAGFDAVTVFVDANLRRELRTYLDTPQAELPAGPLPDFVSALSRQPRAGVTCPGKPRVLLEPPENHAEHCLAVAVYGVLLSPFYRADPSVVFLASMAHHVHNALMPDAGFTGEMLLGDQLWPIVERCAERSLAELEPGLREEVRRARSVLADDATAEGRAFHAADSIDRVLQIAQHLRPGALTMETVLGEMELVHAGPVKEFQDRVLRDMQIP